MRAAVLILFAACSSPPTTILGSTQTFQVDSITLPSAPGAGSQVAIDLNGDGVPDNALSSITAALAAQHDLPSDVADVIAAGVIRESFELTFGVDGAVGIRFDHSEQLHAQPTETGAIATDGGTQPIALAIALPALVDADPIALEIAPTAIELAADAAGYTVEVQGLTDGSAFAAAAGAALVQMLYDSPRDHLMLAAVLDSNHDGHITPAEAAASPLMETFASPDVGSGISIGYSLHVSAAPVQTIIDHCSDRVRDGDETDVDCGGSCKPCGASAACALDADCDSSACVAGACQPPSCSDGIRDGFELSIDCGGGCGGCAAGQRCVVDDDCASHDCDGGGYDFGTCMPVL